MKLGSEHRVSNDTAPLEQKGLRSLLKNLWPSDQWFRDLTVWATSTYSQPLTIESAPEGLKIFIYKGLEANLSIIRSERDSDLLQTPHQNPQRQWYREIQSVQVIAWTSGWICVCRRAVCHLYKWGRWLPWQICIWHLWDLEAYKSLWA